MTKVPFTSFEVNCVNGQRVYRGFVAIFQSVRLAGTFFTSTCRH